MLFNLILGIGCVIWAMCNEKSNNKRVAEHLKDREYLYLLPGETLQEKYIRVEAEDKRRVAAARAEFNRKRVEQGKEEVKYW